MRLIDADALVNKIIYITGVVDPLYTFTLGDVVDAPTVEAEPVRHDEMADEIERLQEELDALKSLLRSKRLVSVDSVLDIIGETAAEALAAMKEDTHETNS